MVFSKTDLMENLSNAAQVVDKVEIQLASSTR